MANITQLINNIRNAVFGKDVRESIASAIEQTYEDASEQGNANMEVVDARGTFDTLKKRLDNSDSVKADNAKIENLQSQINGLASGSPLVASSTSEMTDINKIYVNTTDGNWYYYDGSNWLIGGVYQSTGIDNMSIDIDKLKTSITKHLNSSPTFSKGKILNNGDLMAGEKSVITNVLFLEKGKKVSLYNSLFKFLKFSLYSGEIANMSTHISQSNIDDVEVEIPTNGYYVFQIVYDSTSNFPDISEENLIMIYDAFTIIDDLKEIFDYKDSIKKIFRPKLNWIAGNIDDYGILTLSYYNNNNVIMGMLKKEDFLKIKVIPNSGYQINYALYDNGTFIRRGNWSTKEIELTNEYDIIILGSSIEEGTDKSELTYKNITVLFDDDNYSELVEKVHDIQDQLNKTNDFALDIFSCDFEGKSVHVSIDDTNICLNDLIENENSYTSIFNNAFLNMLKEKHNSYGLCFTLNCFNEDTSTGFDISHVSDKWANEWQNNKNWLRLSFHAKDKSTNYNTATTLNEDYTKFISAVYNFTKDYKCIDTVVRLGFFGGTLNQIKSYNGIYKIKGLLCADDNRLSYYFNEIQNNKVLDNAKYYDLINGYLCFRSMPRLDSPSLNAIKNLIKNNPKYNKYVELFFHEYTALDEISSRLSECGEYFKTNNYFNMFLQDIFMI